MKQAETKQIALMQLKAIGDTLMCEPSIGRHPQGVSAGGNHFYHQ
jgi:hypothetical protein